MRTPLTSEILAAATAHAEAAAAPRAAGGGACASPAAAAMPLEMPKLDVVPIDHAFVPTTDTVHAPTVGSMHVSHCGVCTHCVCCRFVLPRFGFYREAEFVWRYWGAAQLPFGPEVVRFVRAIDVEL